MLGGGEVMLEMAFVTDLQATFVAATNVTSKSVTGLSSSSRELIFKPLVAYGKREWEL